MANTSVRALRLLSLLQTRRYWSGAVLADRLGVSARTLRRDVDRLRELGYPVHANRGVDGGYHLEAGAALPPLVVDDDEAVALAVGMVATAQIPLLGTEDAGLRVLAKIIQVMPKRLRRRVDALRAVSDTVPWAGEPTALDPEVLVVLAQACRDHDHLYFDYTAASGTATHRRVEPYRLVPAGRRWYLVAYDLTRRDWRSFRVDRVTAAAATRAGFHHRALPAPDAATFVRDRLRAARTGWTVEAVVHAEAAVVQDKIGRWAAVTAIGERRCRVEITTDVLDWAVFGLGVLDADFDIVAPDELRTLVARWGGRFSRAAHPDRMRRGRS